MRSFWLVPMANPPTATTRLVTAMPAHCGGSNSDAVRAIVDLPTQLDGTVLLAVNDPTSIAPAAIGTSTAAPMAARRARRCGRRGARRDVRLIAPIGGSADTNVSG